ncbi:MAG: hypothetical protein JWM43_2832 [Acidobacteriaceae bacterium]|nr:hypothetical protein [Acidobacteriaceae bacterium]
MQVLLRKSDSNDQRDIECSVCGQGFRVYWERTSMEERAAMRQIVLDELSAQHAHSNDQSITAHPPSPFNVPKWTGSPQFSGAAMLGGLSGLHRAAGPEHEIKRNA